MSELDECPTLPKIYLMLEPGLNLKNSLRLSLSRCLNFIGGQKVYDFDVFFDAVPLCRRRFELQQFI